jgi:hypothetical protein
MLETTFLGHQGWLFATSATTVLVDPLLVEKFGHGGCIGRVYPPREWSFEAFPRVDAVVLTHEHEDHFNIPSLHRLSREIPIYIPERSSRAMGRYLAEIGFRVAALHGGRSVSIGDLELTPFVADHATQSHADEWDTMPFVIRETADDNSFFSAVDVAPSAAAEAWLRSTLKRPGLWCYTNNVFNHRFMCAGVTRSARYEPLTRGMTFLTEHHKRFSKWGPPAASLICGGGWSFDGDREWINRSGFPLDSGKLFEAFAALCPGERFVVPVPGQTISMAGGDVVSIRERSPFLWTAARDTWPDRRFVDDVLLMDDYQPAGGIRDFGDEEVDELLVHLRDFARFLYGRASFRLLYSMTADELQGRRRAHVLLLRTEQANCSYAIEYDPRGCGFHIADCENPAAEYATGTECYGRDLLELLRGNLSPSALVFGRMRHWGAQSDRVGFDGQLFMYAHPLQDPDRALEFYRRLAAATPDERPCVFARR